MHKWGLFLLTFIASFPLWNCANQTTPMGGPKDTIPPILIKSFPTHKQKNFKAKKIELTFNESVNLFNPKDEILISPTIGEDLEYKFKKKNVSITSPGDWEENTTYTIAFREGIRDLTENNAPANLQLAFSTGPYIDSLTIPGKIKHALQETLPEQITIALFKSDTFNIFEHTPSYFTITNKVGTFSLENIKDGRYYLYAFDDKNKNLKVESRTEKFGFLKEPIILSGPITDSLLIPLISLDTREPSVNNYRNNGLFTMVKFNKYINQYSFEHDSPSPIINSYGDDQTEIVFYNPREIRDSVRISLVAHDSLDLQIDTTFFIKPLEPKFIPSNFNTRPGKVKFDLKSNEITLNFQLSKPLYAINYDSIFIQTDSTHFIPFASEDFTYDTIYKKLTVHKIILPDSLYRPTPPDTLLKARKPKFKPELKMGKGAFISIESDSSKNRQFNIPSTDKTKTGTLLVEVQTEEPYFIVQLLSSGGAIVEEIRNLKKHTFDLLAAQNYKIRVIIDKNNNGFWDPGNIFEWIEPEPTFFYQTADKKYEFPIRVNWELGPIMLIY